LADPEGDDKGSGKAVCAFVTMAVMAFHIAWQTIHHLPIDETSMLELCGFIASLYGIKSYTAVQKAKNNQPPAGS
jgi:hypothetical protein